MKRTLCPRCQAGGPSRGCPDCGYVTEQEPASAEWPQTRGMPEAGQMLAAALEHAGGWFKIYLDASSEPKRVVFVTGADPDGRQWLAAALTDSKAWRDLPEAMRAALEKP